MANSSESCEDWIHDGGIPKANADISGKGVILAFILSAYITFLTTLTAYLCGLVDEELLSSIDQKILYIRPRASKYPNIHAALRQAVLVMGDQQVVTGIAIMGAGFQGLINGSISTYHFQIVIYLAWMSSSVHLSALTLLSSYLNKRKGLLVWRLCGMLVLLLLLVIGLVPTISNDWGIESWPEMLPGRTGWGIPARCFWGRLYGDGISADAVVSLVLLAWSYVWKIGALFSPHRRWYNQYVRIPIENLLVALIRRPAQRYIRSRRLRWLWAFRGALSPALVIFAITEFFTSFAASLWLSVLGLVFGTLQVLIPRRQILPYTKDQENVWQFGQLVPLILLVLPIGAISEHAWPRSNVTEEKKPVTTSHAVTRSDSTAQPSEPRPDSLLSFFYYHSTGAKLSDEERQVFKSMLYRSKLFATLIWLVQASILTTFVIVFDWDGFTIGYTRTHDWISIILVIALSIGTALLTTLIVGPFSRLGRPEPRRDNMLQTKSK